jgi:small subunit ribosomal protein S16
MAVHIRLARHGAKKQPFYRVVVADQDCRRDGRFIERIGTYDPRVDPGRLDIDRQRLEYWTKRGATASHTLARLIKKLPAPEAEATSS